MDASLGSLGFELRLRGDRDEFKRTLHGCAMQSDQLTQSNSLLLRQTASSTQQQPAADFEFSQICLVPTSDQANVRG